MARTTSGAVEEILEDAPTLTLTPFIEAAAHLVTKCCATATQADGTAWYDDTDLELIERWLAAHFYHVAATRPNSERAGSVGETKRSKVDLKLNLTHYGQNAMVLDVAGGLATLNEQGRVIVPRLTWVGTEEEE
jgi:hypothetical protein